MDEQAGWFSWCKPEWEVIRGAPRSFSVSLLAISILIVVGTYWVFHANLDLKNDMISSLKDERDRLNAEIVKLDAHHAQKDQSEAVVYDYKKWFSDKRETIIRKTYVNEAVEIDGKIFDHCRFVNVTFIYHGLAEVTFIQPSYGGVIQAQTDNMAAKAFFSLSTYLRKIPNIETFWVGEKDGNGNVTIALKEAISAKQAQPDLKKKE